MDFRLAARCAAVIEERGGEITIEGDSGAVKLKLLDGSRRESGPYLVGCDGWRYYSRRFGSRPASLRYLVDPDNPEGAWAVRLPGTVKSVSEAIDRLTPAAVKRAADSGHLVGRQGDVYVIRTTRPHDGSGNLPDSHVWDAEARVLRHPQHADVVCGSAPVRLVPQRALRMGRANGRGAAD